MVLFGKNLESLWSQIATTTPVHAPYKAEESHRRPYLTFQTHRQRAVLWQNDDFRVLHCFLTE